MRCLTLLLLATLSLGLAACLSGLPEPPPPPRLEGVDLQVAEMLARMTLEEKIAQLQCRIEVDPETDPDVLPREGIGSYGIAVRPFPVREAAAKANRIQKLVKERTRLGIPVLIHDEGLHGVWGTMVTTFPQAIGLAATWNPDLMEAVAGAIAREARGRGIRQVLSPVVNIARDVRWGRTQETYGEDPWLASRMGVRFCRAMEKHGVIATPKHFAVNVGDGGRDSHPIYMTEHLLREVYFPAFRACVREGGARSLMCAYNSVNGLPCSVNPWLLTEVLRDEWGFAGFVVADYGSASGVVSHHGAARDAGEAAERAIKAGLDVETPNINLYGEPLRQAVREGRVSERTLDTAVGRVLRAKYEIGLMDDPVVSPETAARGDPSHHRTLALRAAQESITLLKNHERCLPLRRGRLSKIAVFGAAAGVPQLGNYSGTPVETSTLLDAIRERVGQGAVVSYLLGAEVALPGGLPPVPASAFPRGLRAQYYANKDLEGTPTLIRTESRVHFDWKQGGPAPGINADYFSARWVGDLVPPVSDLWRFSATSEDGVRVYLDDLPLIDTWGPRSRATDFAAIRLEAGRAYRLRVDFQHYRGHAYASLGWERAGKTKPPSFREEVERARDADAIVVAVGILEGEARDRSCLDLPGRQEALIRAVAATGKPTVVVVFGGSAVTMGGWKDHVGAIVQAWYPGQAAGHAVTDVLFGDYNPAGRLPITFPRTVGQVPLTYHPRPSGRAYGYVDGKGLPAFAFGHGLSYTQFDYQNFGINPARIEPDGTVVVSVDVVNTGDRAGDEVVQLYFRDLVASVVRPLRELAGFRRVSLNPGERQTVTFEIPADRLAFFDASLRRVVEPGRFKVMVGASSADIRCEGEFEVRKRDFATPAERAVAAAEAAKAAKEALRAPPTPAGTPPTPTPGSAPVEKPATVPE